MLTKCPECDHEVSDQAESCPNCGARPAAAVGDRWPLALRLGIGAFAALIVILSVYATTHPAGGSAPAPPAETADDACLMAREFVKDRLKAPATADFSDCPASAAADAAISTWREPGGDWEAKGYVDSENSFGAKLRLTYYVRLEHVGGARWRASSVQVKEPD